MSKRRLFFSLVGLLVLVGVMITINSVLPCFREMPGTDPIVFPTMDAVPTECWTKLSQKKIFFGHKSVGYNILDGIQDVMQDHPAIELRVLETVDPSAFSHPVFAHAQVGRNTDPSSKINDFVRFIDSGIGDQVDIAFFKFCYVDVDRRTTPQKVFVKYETVMGDLARRYPHTTFLNVTTPLCALPTSAIGRLKHLVKCALRLPGLPENNQARERYNRLVIDRYEQGGGVFDLALVESVDSSGYPNKVMGKDQTAMALVSQYTDDGCHLNEKGRKRAAEQLLIKLASLACER